MSQNDRSENELSKSTQFQLGNKFSKGRPLGSKNKKKQLTKEKILRDMEFIYLKSVKERQWFNALSAKVWQGKFLGIARTRKLPDITKLSDMDGEQLREFVEVMSEHDSKVRDAMERQEKSYGERVG